MAIELKTQRIPTPEEAFQGIILGSSQPNDMVQKIDISLLDEIENQPFKINPKKVENYAASIEECGLLEPIQVRAKDSSRYEILAGRHRVRACKLLGCHEIDCIVKKTSDTSARLILLKTNTDREDDFSPSELGFAYTEEDQLLKSLRDVRPRTEEQRKKIYRYKRITHLVESLRQMVDEDRIKLSVGAELSFLTHTGQIVLAEYLLAKKQKISEKQAKNLKDLETETCLSETVLDEFFHPKAKKKQVKEVKLQIKDISDYIPLHILENGGAQDYILEALSFYQNYNK